MTRTLAMALAVPAVLLTVLGCGAGSSVSQASAPRTPTSTPASHSQAPQHGHHRAHGHFYDGRRLPACKVEDGNGQALCWWNAKRQGNHKGRSVISGDCAPSIMGDRRTVRLCVKLHAQKAYDAPYQDSTTHTPAGPALIDECVADARVNFGHAPGTSMAECLAAWIK